MPLGIHQGFIPLRLHGIRHLLDRCDNQLTVRILELPDQDKGTVRIIDTILFKGIVFIHRLVIEILAVNEENHLINARLVAQELGQLLSEYTPLSAGFPETSHGESTRRFPAPSAFG